MADGIEDGLTEASHSGDPAPRSYAPGVKLLQRRTFDLDLQVSMSPADVECWLLGAASKVVSANALTEGFACRLAEARLGVARLSLNVGTLHPQLYGYAWNWSALDGICDETQIGEEALFSDAYLKNPLFRVIEHGEVVRLVLADEKGETQSPLMEELAAAGFAEYVGVPLSASGERYNAVTLATQQAGGRETIQIRPARPTPQMLKHLWRQKICLQHSMSPLVTGHQWPSASTVDFSFMETRTEAAY